MKLGNRVYSLEGHFMNAHLFNLENILTVLSASQFYRTGSTEKSSNQPKATQQMADIESVPKQQVSVPKTWQIQAVKEVVGTSSCRCPRWVLQIPAFGDLTVPAAETDFPLSIG